MGRFPLQNDELRDNFCKCGAWAGTSITDNRGWVVHTCHDCLGRERRKPGPKPKNEPKTEPKTTERPKKTGPPPPPLDGLTVKQLEIAVAEGVKAHRRASRVRGNRIDRDEMVSIAVEALAKLAVKGKIPHDWDNLRVRIRRDIIDYLRVHGPLKRSGNQIEEYLVLDKEYPEDERPAMFDPPDLSAEEAFDEVFDDGRYEILDGVPPAQARTMILASEDFSDKEIALILGISPQVVRNYKTRARQAIAARAVA